MFEVLYGLSIGLERLFKIAIVLFEHKDDTNQAKFEKSLITHDHVKLLERLSGSVQVEVTEPGKELLGLLARFYKNLRYGRFSLQSVGSQEHERAELLRYLGGHFNEKFTNRDSVFGVFNDDRFRAFLRGQVTAIAKALYTLIGDRAHALNLYTDELRYGSKAWMVFHGDSETPSEDVVWKELLIYLMNTTDSNGILNHMRSIDPLPFDAADVQDHLQIFQADSSKGQIMDEVESHYDDIPDKVERLSMLSLIANPNVFFPEDDEDPEDNEERFEPLDDRDDEAGS
jgi:hypothetical protein